MVHRFQRTCNYRPNIPDRADVRRLRLTHSSLEPRHADDAPSTGLLPERQRLSCTEISQ